MIRSFFFMAGMMAAGGTSMAESIPPCPVDTVPIQIVKGVDEHPVTTLSAARIPDFPPGFATFVTAVTGHVAAKLAQEKLCLDSAESQERSLLQFLPRPVITSQGQPLVLVAPLEVRPSGGCRISSPWIDLVIEREPVPSVRAIVRFSERQLLADQAVLAGARNVPPGVALPLPENEFIHYVFEYEGSELPPRPAAKPIEERVPPDLLWLFRRAWQSTRGPFGGSARSALNRAMEKGAEGYTEIVIALIDQGFASDGADIHYDSILDVADLISLEQYKIVTPLR